MPSKAPPDIYKLKKTGDVRGLFRLLRHPHYAVRSDAAQALATMSLKPRDSKKAQKLIAKILKKDEAKQDLFRPDPISMAKYKHSLILLEKPEQGDALLGLYKIWFNAYLELLQEHKHRHGGSFKLGLDSDRIRMARVEQVAKQVIRLSSEVAKDGARGFIFVFTTAGHIELLERTEGIKWLTIEEHEGHHDWSRSREVYKKMCRLLKEVTRLEFGLDHARWIKLGNNLVALMMAGEYETLLSLTTDPKLWSAIAKRTDLSTPSPAMRAIYMKL
ncbi:MAG: hypothetical protein PVI78_02310 [Anaerolineales bacterium]|jgi:hypothetical protein